MVNPFIKKKRNTVMGANIGGFVAYLVLSVIASVFANLFGEVLADILSANYNCMRDSLVYFSHFISYVVSTLIFFGSVLAVNSSSRKAGKPEACVSPAFAVVTYAIFQILFYFTNTITQQMYANIDSYDSYSSIGVFSGISFIFNFLVAIVLGIVAFKLLFKSEDNRTAAIRAKVMALKETETPVSAEKKSFSVYRIIVLAVFVLSSVLRSVISYFGEIFIDILSFILVSVVSVAAVFICNMLCKKNNAPEDTLPLATIFVPFSVGMISAVFTNLYSSITYLLNADIGSSSYYSKYDYDKYYQVSENIGEVTPIISFVIGIIAIIIFTLLVFKHEDKQFKTLIANGYYEKEEILTPPVQAPVQPIYQQPVQPVYQQPVQPVYQQPVQPVYQQPVQPVYQQPVQPVYQQPVQPVYQQPVQPVYQQPVQPVYQQPVQPVYQQPVYQQPVQPVYQQPIQQPAPQAPAQPQPEAPAEVNNSENQ